MSALRVLLAPLGHFLSHRSRCLAVAEALHARGHVVAFQCVPGEEDFFRSRGLQAFAASQLAPASIIAFGAPLAYQRRFLAEGGAPVQTGSFGVAQMVEDDLAVYQAFQPDVVVWDGRPTSPQTASLQGIVAIGINNLSMPYDDGPAGLAVSASGEAADGFAMSDAGPAATVQSRFQAELRQVLMPRLQASAQHARFSRQLAWIVPGLPVTENRAKLGLLGNPAHVYVGGLHWRGWDDLPAPPPRHPEHPRILMTLGSSFPFLRQVSAWAGALAEDGCEVVVNMDGLDAAGAFHPGASHPGVELRPRLNLRAYLESCDAVVHHGGHGTALEALRAGVPAVMVPFNGDQIDIARRIAALGCGRHLAGYPADLSGHEVRDAVRRVRAEPGYRTQAARFREELARWPEGAVLAADYIERRVPQLAQVLQ